MDLHSIMMISAIALASNLDNAGVGIAYGIRNIYISWYANLMIACLSFLATFFGGIFGNWISDWITPFVGNLIGTIVIVSVGVWVLSQPLIENKKNGKKADRNILGQILQNPEEADRDQSKKIGFGESIILGVALSLNAIAGGFDAGITKLNVFVTSSLVGILSFILIWSCVYIGRRFAADKVGNKATIISGVLLILIGLKQLF